MSESLLTELRETDATMRGSNPICRKQSPYHNFYTFVVTEGVIMPWEPHQPDWARHGWTPRACFSNALTAILQRPRGAKKYVYVEGFARVGAHFPPTLHAWILDTHSMKVVDPTWVTIAEEQDEIPEYVGVPFRWDWVARRLISGGCVIDDWKAGWPTLTHPDSVWRHKAYDRIKQHFDGTRFR